MQGISEDKAAGAFTITIDKILHPNFADPAGPGSVNIYTWKNFTNTIIDEKLNLALAII